MFKPQDLLAKPPTAPACSSRRKRLDLPLILGTA